MIVIHEISAWHSLRNYKSNSHYTKNSVITWIWSKVLLAFGKLSIRLTIWRRTVIIAYGQLVVYNYNSLRTLSYFPIK